MGIDLRYSNSLTGKILASGQVASANSDTVAYIVPIGSIAQIKTASLTNVSGAQVTVSISIVPPDTTPSAAHKVVSNFSLAADDSTRITEFDEAIFQEGSRIIITASGATAINYLFTGQVYS